MKPALSHFSKAQGMIVSPRLIPVESERVEGVEAAPTFGSAVSLRDLRKSFGPVVAVDNVCLDVAPGEFMSLLGPSGSGKTTVLMMVAGFETPDSGNIRVGDEDLTDLPPYHRDLGMVFQSYALFPHMTVYENIAYPLRLRKLSPESIRKRIHASLEMVQLPADRYAHRYPKQLSGGQQQRVALVRALIYEPRVLLMDEPMGALDKNLRSELKLELRALQRRLKITVVYVTHDQEEALTLSDRVAVMNKGRIEQIGAPETLYRRPKNRFIANFLGDANLLQVKRCGLQQAMFSNGTSFMIHGGAMPQDRDEFLLLLRPEDVEIAGDGRGLLQGRVSETIYLGSLIRAEVDTALGRITMLNKAVHMSGLARGDSVSLTFSTKDPVLLPTDL
jgi:putative spermidine/putrescine transport system ATP-binding protein